MSELITIPKTQLKKILDLTSTSLVGKILRRFEVLSDIKAVKASTKELIYEESRTLFNLLEKFSDGMEVNVFKVQTKSEDSR